MLKFSVIIPVYKVEPYIRRCIDSVIKQTYSNWEAICVDDGSPDNCPQILDEYAAKDERIKVIHTENKGLSCARNTALEKVTGEYTIFIDSDDFIHPQLLEICAAQVEENDPDLIAYTYNRRFRAENKVRFYLNLPARKAVYHYSKYNTSKIKSVTTYNIFNYVTEYSHQPLPDIDNKFIVKHCQVWRCCYRSQIIKDVKFIQGIFFEDMPWWGEVLQRVKVATINNLPLYYYYPNETSFIINGSQMDKLINLKKSVAAAEKIYEERGTAFQKRVWEERFLVPFRAHITKKIAKYGDLSTVQQ